MEFPTIIRDSDTITRDGGRPRRMVVDLGADGARISGPEPVRTRDPLTLIGDAGQLAGAVRDLLANAGTDAVVLRGDPELCDELAEELCVAGRAAAMATSS